MRYTGHFVETRRGATIYALVVFGVLLSFLAMRADLSQPLQTTMLAIMTLMPLTVGYRCLHFLAKMEQTHNTPTPEMTFIFGLAVSLPMALGAFVLITINHYK